MACNAATNGARVILLLPPLWSALALRRQRGRRALGGSGEAAPNEADIAGSGEELWPLLERETPDAIVMDLHLPGTDGWMLIRELRTQDAWKRVPILVVSACVRETEREQLVAAELLEGPEERRDALGAGGHVGGGVARRVPRGRRPLARPGEGVRSPARPG